MVNKHEPMQMFRSAKTAKVVHELEDKPKRNYEESKEQGTIAGYLKKYHPDVFFETVEREGRRSYGAQNRIVKNNSEGSFPDTRIYKSRAGYHSLMIENKKAGIDLFQKRDTKKFAKLHFEEQYRTHLRLIEEGHAVYFGVGISQSIEIIERYLDGNPLPLLKVDYTPFHPVDDSLFTERGL